MYNNNYNTGKSFRNFFLICAAFIVIALPIAIMYSHQQTETIKIISINTRMHVSGSDGNTSSTYEYLVSTDKGIFKIEPDGIFHSNDFGNLVVGETYTVKTCGFSVPILGIYPFILEII